MRAPLLSARRAPMTVCRVVVCTALAFALAACSAPAPASAPPGRDADALDFAGTTVDGAQFSAAALAGAPVVLWFWTPY